jgi:hypothetical protein
LDVLFQLKRRTLTAGVLELRSAGFLPNTQLKGLANVGTKPRTLRKLLLVIGDVDYVLIGNATLHTLNLREMRASRFRQHHAGQSTHLRSRMRTLHLALDLLGDLT